MRRHLTIVALAVVLLTPSAAARQGATPSPVQVYLKASFDASGPAVEAAGNGAVSFVSGADDALTRPNEPWRVRVRAPRGYGSRRTSCATSCRTACTSRRRRATTSPGGRSCGRWIRCTSRSEIASQSKCQERAVALDVGSTVRSSRAGGDRRDIAISLSSSFGACRQPPTATRASDTRTRRRVARSIRRTRWREFVRHAADRATDHAGC